MKRRGVVRIDSSGAVRPLDPVAIQELGSHDGELQVLPSPRDLVFLKRVPKGKDLGRTCRLSGEINTPGALCDIVAFIGYAHWRGELLAFDGVCGRTIYFDGDNVVSAQSTAEQERLGHVLYRRGALTRAQVMEAATATKQRKVRFGEAIVQLGFLTGDELFRLMEAQAREVFDAAIRIESGAFYFFDGFEEARLAFRLRCPVSSMLTDAVRRMDEVKFFRERIPSADHVPVRVPGRVPDSNTNRLYPVVDGARSIREICRIVRAEELEVTRALFELVQAGYITIEPPKMRSVRAIVDVFNQAMKIVLHELDVVGSGNQVRQQLAAFTASGGVYGVLFANAGPAKDGSLDLAVVEQNFARLSTPGDPATMLSEWLYDYASYALFLARPHLERAETGTADGSVPPSAHVDSRRLSSRLRVVLSPIAPRGASRGTK